ncbi:hypothetical protein AGMMS49546_05300 [Spirochaetia bacterium]|nr:hypothetical protein AGMMS49546_05300 [Spirochaetia bacterium]
MRSFPFPDKIVSRDELTRDLLYEKIPKEDLNTIADKAWETGAAAAQAILEAYPGKTMAEIARAEYLKVEYIPRDQIAGKVRYFSEYYSGPKKIYMYSNSIEKWAESNKLEKEDACELILSHEFFHHLECTRLGLTSKQYTVPRFRIGNVKIGAMTIRALSEIGAHGFSYTFYQNRNVQSKDYLRNHAVNDMVFSGHKKAEKIFEDNPVMRFLTGKNKEKNHG